MIQLVLDDPPDTFLDSISGVITDTWTVFVRMAAGQDVVILYAPKSECISFLRSVSTVKGPVVSCCMMDIGLARTLLHPLQHHAIDKLVESGRKKGRNIKTVLWCSSVPLDLWVRDSDGTEIPAANVLRSYENIIKIDQNPP
jgi:hypothetical protein